MRLRGMALRVCEGIQQCEIASVQGRKYCLTHLASRPTSVSAIRTSRTSTTVAKP